jgi:hypothetical protein
MDRLVSLVVSLVVSGGKTLLAVFVLGGVAALEKFDIVSLLPANLSAADAALASAVLFGVLRVVSTGPVLKGLTDWLKDLRASYPVSEPPANE